MLRYRPEVACISVGTNDAKLGADRQSGFRRSVRDLLHALRGEGIVPVLQTPNLAHLPACDSRSALPTYVEILREEAAAAETPLVDHWAHWAEWHLPAENVLAWLGDGRYQPNHLGHRELARLLLHTLGLFDPHSTACAPP